MKKLVISLLTFISASTLCAQQNEKSITVRTETGEEEIIDLPAGMLSETDSLYLDWISKHYINPAENCVMTQPIMSRKTKLTSNTVGSGHTKNVSKKLD